MTTKANRTKAAQKRIEQAKKQYGLAPGFWATVLRLASNLADSPWSLAVSLAALVAVIVVLAL
jgi:hypothetical protein